MKITFLGTASGEGYPSPWCDCVNCQKARELGGRNIRSRSALMVNDDLLIDAGPDITASAARFRIALNSVQALLLTHSHDDHLDAGTLRLRHTMASATPLPALTIYGSSPSLSVAKTATRNNNDEDWLRVKYRALTAFDPTVIDTGFSSDNDPRYSLKLSAVHATTHRRYQLWPLRAHHMRPEDQAFIYILQQVGATESRDSSGPTILYAIDTGPFLDDTWAELESLASSGMQLDAVIMDATMGTGHPEELHMNGHQAAAHMSQLETLGLVTDGTLTLAHHFSHYFSPPHHQLRRQFSKLGLQPTYDGLRLEIRRGWPDQSFGRNPIVRASSRSPGNH